MANPEAPLQLIQILSEELDWRERRRACRLLGRTKAPEAVPALLNALEDGDDDVVQSAILALIQVGAAEMVDGITRPRILLSENSSVRWAAAHALGFIGTASHFHFLYKLIDDKDWIVRNEAIATLEKLIARIREVHLNGQGDFADFKLLIRMLTIEHQGLHDQLVTTLVSFGDRAYEDLIASLVAENENILVGVIRALACLNRPICIPSLIQQINHESLTVRREVIRALKKLGGCRAVNAIVERLGDGQRQVVDEAVAALVEMGSEPYTLDILIDRLRNVFDVAIRKNLLLVMGRIRHSSLIIPILDHLGNSYFFIRAVAAQAIARFGEDVRHNIEELMIINESPIEALLTEATGAETVRARVRAIHALGHLKNPRALRDLDKLTQDEIEVVSHAAEEAFSLTYASVWARANGAMVLGQLGGEASVPPLVAALEDESRIVRLAAMKALRSLRDASTSDAIADHMEREKRSIIRAEAAAALGDMGSYPERSRKVLLAALLDRSELVRAEAARALGKFRDDEVVDALIDTFRDDYFTVRRNVQNAIYTIGESTIPKVIQALETSTDLEVKLHCIDLLGIFAPHGDSCPTLEKMLDRESDPVVIERIRSVLQILTGQEKARRSLFLDL